MLMQEQLNAAVRACQENSADALEQLQRAIKVTREADLAIIGRGQNIVFNVAREADLPRSGEVQKIVLPRAMVTSYLYFFSVHMHELFIAATLQLDYSTISYRRATYVCAQIVAALSVIEGVFLLPDKGGPPPPLDMLRVLCMVTINLNMETSARFIVVTISFVTFQCWRR